MIFYAKRKFEALEWSSAQQSKSNCGRQPTPTTTSSSATMFAKRLLHKAVQHHSNVNSKKKSSLSHPTSFFFFWVSFTFFLKNNLSFGWFLFSTSCSMVVCKGVSWIPELWFTMAFHPLLQFSLLTPFSDFWLLGLCQFSLSLWFYC